MEQGYWQMKNERVIAAWAEFHMHAGGLGRPETEEDYERILGLLGDLTENYDCDQEPYSSLFDLLTNYAHTWEHDNEPELKQPTVSPREMLSFLMEEREISQYQLAQEGVVNQGNLSNILAGRRTISKELAKKLAAYFDVSVELFI